VRNLGANHSHSARHSAERWTSIQWPDGAQSAQAEVRLGGLVQENRIMRKRTVEKVAELVLPTGQYRSVGEKHRDEIQCRRWRLARVVTLVVECDMSFCDLSQTCSSESMP
jgi:hypothetical protein